MLFTSEIEHDLCALAGLFIKSFADIETNLIIKLRHEDTDSHSQDVGDYFSDLSRATFGVIRGQLQKTMQKLGSADGYVERVEDQIKIIASLRNDICHNGFMIDISTNRALVKNAPKPNHVGYQYTLTQVDFENAIRDCQTISLALGQSTLDDLPAPEEMKSVFRRAALAPFLYKLPKQAPCP